MLDNAKTPHKPYTCVDFLSVTLGDLINSGSHQSDFVDTPNVPSNDDLIVMYHHTDNDGDTYMILANLYKRETFFLWI